MKCVTWWDRHHCFYDIPAKDIKPKFNHDETSINQNWRTLLKIIDLQVAKVSKSSKSRKDWGTAPYWRKLKRHDNKMHCMILGCIFLLHQTLLGQLAKLEWDLSTRWYQCISVLISWLWWLQWNVLVSRKYTLKHSGSVGQHVDKLS